MVSTQGEIRVGPSHQARLPEYRSGGMMEVSPPDPELTREREELRWMPGMTLDGDLLMYLRAARSMAAFAGMCDGGSADDGCIAASRDDTTINALDVLHDSTYDPGKALQALVKCPVPKGIEKKWCEDETKRFVKGLRQFGKNFFRIRKDLLPHKDTPELVEFYYLWKKTPGANNNRPHRRRRQGSLRRIRNTRNSPRAKDDPSGTLPNPNSPASSVGGGSRPSPNPNDKGDGDESGSDEDNSEDDSDSRDNGNFRCQHCFSTNSRDFGPGGPKERAVLCAECRAYYKKYGELPANNSANNNNSGSNNNGGSGGGGGSGRETPYLFRPVQTDSPDGSPGRMRTRNKAKETPTKSNGVRPKRSSGTNTPDNEIEKKGAKSPGASSTCSNSPSDRAKKKIKIETPTKGRKRNADLDIEEEVSLFKKKRERAESPSESVTTDSGSVVDDGETGEGDGGREASPAPVQPVLEETKTDGGITDEATDSNLSLPPPLAQEDRLAFIKSEDAIFEPVIPKKEVEAVKEEEEEKVMVPSPPPQPLDDKVPPPVSPPPQEKCKADDLFSLSSLPKAFEDIPSPGKITVKKEALFDTESLVMPVSVETFGVSKEEPPGSSEQAAPLFGPPPVKLEPEESSNTETSQEGVALPLSQEPPPPSPVLLPVYPPPTESPLGEEKGSPPGQSVLVPPYPPPIPPPAPVEQDKPPAPPPQPQHSFSPFYHPHFHKPSSTYFNSLQSEPQNLKIKQEVLAPDQSQPPATDPLQSLKEVKVPGYSGTSISQPLLPTPAAASVPQGGGERAESSSSPFPPIESIKKEQPEYSGRSATPGKSPRPPQAEQPSPSFPPPPSIPSSSSGSGVVAPSPSRVSPAHLPHPHPFVPAIHHPHHPLIHHSLFAAAAAHAAAVHSPYHHHPYPYPYPFPYGPYPIPQPIPPPSRSHHDSGKSGEGTTIMTSHHSSSSSVTTRSVREESREDEITHHSSHHSSHQSTTSLHQGEKQPHPLTISHSTSSSSSSVQHKITSAKRTNSPHLPQVGGSCHMSSTVSQTSSASLSTNQGHQHVHSHLHLHQSASSGDRLSPNIPFQHNRKSCGGVMHPGGSSLDALRAAAIHSVSLQPSHGVHPGGYGELVKGETITVSSDEAGGGPDEEEIPSPNHHIPRGPSPEPKIEDNECHRSQSAIFLRHWNRGDYNSCTRTDLTFKPVPESKLARKREERIRKQAEKEREEREKIQARKVATPEKGESSKPPSRGPIESISSPYERFNPRLSAYPDTPALRQLSEYARPHGGFSPVSLQRSGGGIPAQCIDPMLHYQINSMYAPPPRERLELEQLEREKRERELRELRERELNERLKEELMKNAAAASQPRIDPHWIDLHRRYGNLGGGGGGGLHQFGLYPGAPPTTAPQLDRERIGGGGGYPRAGLLGSGREPPSLGLHHPTDLLARPYADQLAHQAHEHLQRQMLMERERFPHPLVAQHEEFLRQQRERELKVRALEEAARASRP